MNLPNQAQIEAGRAVASELTNASCQHAMRGLGGCKEFDIENFTYKPLVLAYINNEIDSVTAIWIAMNEAGQ